MTGGWRTARDRVVGSFDRIADLYRQEYADKLYHKPADQDLFRRVIPRLPRRHTVLEVGAGPGQVRTFLTAHGVSVVVSDASPAHLRQARHHNPAARVLAADLACLPVRTGTLGGGIVAYYCLMYGHASHLDTVFTECHRALAPAGLAVVVVHASAGTIRATEWRGRTSDIELVLVNAPRNLTL